MSSNSYVRTRLILAVLLFFTNGLCSSLTRDAINPNSTLSLLETSTTSIGSSPTWHTINGTPYLVTNHNNGSLYKLNPAQTGLVAISSGTDGFDTKHGDFVFEFSWFDLDSVTYLALSGFSDGGTTTRLYRFNEYLELLEEVPDALSTQPGAGFNNLKWFTHDGKSYLVIRDATSTLLLYEFDPDTIDPYAGSPYPLTLVPSGFDSPPNALAGNFDIASVNGTTTLIIGSSFASPHLELYEFNAYPAQFVKQTGMFPSLPGRNPSHILFMQKNGETYLIVSHTDVNDTAYENILLYKYNSYSDQYDQLTNGFDGISLVNGATISLATIKGNTYLVLVQQGERFKEPETGLSFLRTLRIYRFNETTEQFESQLIPDNLIPQTTSILGQDSLALSNNGFLVATGFFTLNQEESLRYALYDFLCSPVGLQIRKEVNDKTPQEGDTITYTIIVKNVDSTDVANGVTVDDTLPAGLTFVSSMATQGSYDSGSGIWTVGSLALEQEETLTITATVNAGTKNNFVVNSATVTDAYEPLYPAFNAVDESLFVQPSCDVQVCPSILEEFKVPESVFPSPLFNDGMEANAALAWQTINGRTYLAVGNRATRVPTGSAAVGNLRLYELLEATPGNYELQELCALSTIGIRDITAINDLDWIQIGSDFFLAAAGRFVSGFTSHGGAIFRFDDGYTPCLTGLSTFAAASTSGMAVAFHEVSGTPYLASSHGEDLELFEVSPSGFLTSVFSLDLNTLGPGGFAQLGEDLEWRTINGTDFLAFGGNGLDANLILFRFDQVYDNNPTLEIESSIDTDLLGDILIADSFTLGFVDSISWLTHNNTEYLAAGITGFRKKWLVLFKTTTDVYGSTILKEVDRLAMGISNVSFDFNSQGPRIDWITIGNRPYLATTVLHMQNTNSDTPQVKPGLNLWAINNDKLLPLYDVPLAVLDIAFADDTFERKNRVAWMPFNGEHFLAWTGVASDNGFSGNEALRLFKMCGEPSVYDPASFADIEVEVTADQTTGMPFNPITYTVTVRNNGDQTLCGVRVDTSMVPTGFSFSFANASLGEYDECDGTWFINELAPSPYGEETLEITVEPNLMAMCFNLVATVNTFNNTDPYATNNTASFEVCIPENSVAPNSRLVFEVVAPTAQACNINIF